MAAPYPISEMPEMQRERPGLQSLQRLVASCQLADLRPAEIAACARSQTDNKRIIDIADEFLSSAGGQRRVRTVHQLCNAMIAIEPAVVDAVADLLCTKTVSADASSRARKAMQLQRERTHASRMSEATVDDERYER